ncbi:MAG: LacI family DNA-binding transcriptional regulator, partial [Deltaproteobacteria bacterium]|nr:LacI family DNA-binding transcriptional regulator [Deltaproteobacteria bacterium]
MKKATIIDVAEAAGVSSATVDRVLNGRAGVRPETVAKVRTAILRLNYKPAAEKRAQRLLFIIREGRNTFMVQLLEAVDDLALRLKEEGVYVEKRLVDDFDPVSAAKALDEVSPLDWDGVAAVVPDLPLVRQAVDSCVGRGVKVVSLVSDLPSSARYRFIGIDNT